MEQAKMEVGTMKLNKFISSFKDINLPLHGVRLPSFEISTSQKRKAGFSESLNNFDFLRSLSEKRLKELVPENSDRLPLYVKRLNHELSTIFYWFGASLIIARSRIYP